MDQARKVSPSTKLELERTDYGYYYAGIMPLGEGEDYLRVNHFVLPYHQLRAKQLLRDGLKVAGHMWVPMDDENTMVWNMIYSYGEEPLTEDERLQRGMGNAVGTDLDPVTFRSYQNRENDYKIDREVQRTKDYPGIAGQNTQDRAVQESMGPIVDRTKEHLGLTDSAIVTARRMLIQATKTVEDGGDPPGTAPTYYRVRAVDKLIPEGARWQEEVGEELHGSDGRG